MNQVQKIALKETAKTIGVITVLVFGISLAITLLSVQTIAGIALVYCLVMAIKLIYSIKLSEAEIKQREIDAEIDRLHK